MCPFTFVKCFILYYLMQCKRCEWKKFMLVIFISLSWYLVTYIFWLQKQLPSYHWCKVTCLKIFLKKRVACRTVSDGNRFQPQHDKSYLLDIKHWIFNDSFSHWLQSQEKLHNKPCTHTPASSGPHSPSFQQSVIIPLFNFCHRKGKVLKRRFLFYMYQPPPIPSFT